MGRLDVGGDDDEDDTAPQKPSELGVVSLTVDVSWFVGDVVGTELELWMASNSRRAIAAFVPVVMRW